MVKKAVLSISGDYIKRAAQSGGVRKGLRDKANQVKRQAENLAEAEDVQMDIWLKEGTRPQGRPYVDVVTDAVAQEYGDSIVGRKRILGRAAERA